MSYIVIKYWLFHFSTITTTCLDTKMELKQVNQLLHAIRTKRDKSVNRLEKENKFCTNLSPSVRNSCLWSNAVFEKAVISHWQIWIEIKTSADGSKSKHLKAHNFLWQGCSFFHYYYANSPTKWAKISIFCYISFYANVEIHQVRRLAFDNYQAVPDRNMIL